MSNSEDNKKPLDSEPMTLEQEEKVVGGVAFNTSAYNTAMINTSDVNTATFNTAMFNGTNLGS